MKKKTDSVSKLKVIYEDPSAINLPKWYKVDKSFPKDMDKELVRLGKKQGKKNVEK
jgi:hypothetical protein